MRTLLAGIALAVAGLPAVQMGAVRRSRCVRQTGWETWWHSDSAPSAWRAPLPAVTDRVTWRQVAPGVERGEFSLSGDGEAFRVRVIVVRLDPAQVEFKLVKPKDGKVFAGRWEVSEAPEDAIFAVNAGQFTDTQPWGWLVQDGVERQAPGRGRWRPASSSMRRARCGWCRRTRSALVSGSAAGVPVISDAAVR